MMEGGIREKFTSSFGAKDLAAGENAGGSGGDRDSDDPNNDLPSRWNPASLVAAARARQPDGKLDSQGFYRHAKGRADAAYSKVQTLVSRGKESQAMPIDYNLHSIGKQPGRKYVPTLKKHESIVWGDESVVSTSPVENHVRVGSEEEREYGSHVEMREDDSSHSELDEANHTYLANSTRVEKRMWRKERRRLVTLLCVLLAFLGLCVGLRTRALRRNARGGATTPPWAGPRDDALGSKEDSLGKKEPPPRPLPAAPVAPPDGFDDPSVPAPTLTDLQYIANEITPNAAVLNDPRTPQSKALAWAKADIAIYNAEVASRVAQRYVLATLLYSTNGTGWQTNTNWGQGHECEWYGVGCETGEDEVAFVTYLDLNSNNLDGTIPEEIGYIKSLQQIYLWGNHLSGSIPGSLSRLIQLHTLYLDGNLLDGEVGNTFNPLKNLKHLDLSGNRLRGHVPHGLGTLTNLRDLRLSANFLTSTLPSSLISLSNLQTLLLDSNALSGSLPSLIGEMRSLVIIRIHENDMSGRLPSFSDAERLEEVHFDGNYFSGTIPHFGSSRLRELYLGQNALTGSIPPNIGNLTKLETFSASNNRLSSTIPSSLSRATELQVLDLSHNKLSGSIPREFSDLVRMHELHLDHNHLRGFPDFLGAMLPLEVVRLNNNLLDGELGLPLEMGDLDDLTEFAIENNDLRGVVGEFMCDLLLDVLTADCWGSTPLIDCPCCTECY